MGSGITLKKTAAAAIDTPSTDKATVFLDDTGQWSTKDDAGAVESLAEAAGAYSPGGTDVAVADGGTGAGTAAGARTNLGVDTAIAAAIAALVASSPSTLDTLNELAAALGNDPNFAATLVTSLAGKQPLDSDLTAIAAIAPANDDVIQRKGGAWVNRTMAQLAADLPAGGSALIVKEEGTNVDTAVTSIDFVGATVTATAVGHAITVTITGGGGSVTDDVDAAASLFNAANFR